MSHNQTRRFHSPTEAIEEFKTFAFPPAVGFLFVIETMDE